MPQSLSLVILHLIFSTKDRRPLLTGDVQPKIHAYLATVIRNADCECYRAAVVADHVHLAIRLSRTITIADLVEQLKTLSSKWLKTQSRALAAFAWQRGHASFPVGPADVESLNTYIDRQEEHHRNRTFQDEFRMFLKKIRGEIRRGVCLGLRCVETGFQPLLVRWWNLGRGLQPSSRHAEVRPTINVPPEKLHLYACYS